MKKILSTLKNSSRFLGHYWQVTKPSLTRLVVLTSLAGAAVAPGSLSFIAWITLLLGSWGIVSSANAVNCVFERDVDAYMERTKTRPLVTGDLKAKPTLVFSLFLAALSLILLFKHHGVMCAALGALGFVLYVSVYTPLKRISMSALFIGAIPGAIPPLMGWAAVEPKLSVGAWILFAILFFWQLPHFIAIALFRVNDYERAGLKTMPGEWGVELAQKHMFFYTAALLAISLLPLFYGMAGIAYLVVQILIIGCSAALCVIAFLKIRTFNWNRVVFFASLLYLPLVFGAWVVDLWLVSRNLYVF